MDRPVSPTVQIESFRLSVTFLFWKASKGDYIFPTAFLYNFVNEYEYNHCL